MKSVFLRGLRTTIQTVLAGFVAAHQSDPAYLAIAPALAMLGKFLRQKFPGIANVLPF